MFKTLEKIFSFTWEQSKRYFYVLTCDASKFIMESLSILLKALCIAKKNVSKNL